MYDPSNTQVLSFPSLFKSGSTIVTRFPISFMTCIIFLSLYISKFTLSLNVHSYLLIQHNSVSLFSPKFIKSPKYSLQFLLTSALPHTTSPFQSIWNKYVFSIPMQIQFIFYQRAFFHSLNLTIQYSLSPLFHSSSNRLFHKIISPLTFSCHNLQVTLK